MCKSVLRVFDSATLKHGIITQGIASLFLPVNFLKYSTNDQNTIPRVI